MSYYVHMSSGAVTLDETNLRLRVNGRFDSGVEENVIKDGSDNVSEMSDLETTGDDDLTQGTGGNQPLWVDDVVNLKDAVRFNGTSDHLDKLNPSFINDAQGMLFIVVRFSSTADYYLWSAADLSSATEFFGMRHFSDEKIRLFARTGGTDWHVEATTTVTAINTTYLIYLDGNGSTWNMRINDTVQTLNTITTGNGGKWFNDVATADNFALGALVRSTLALELDGDVLDLLIYSDVDATKRANVTSYLSNEYNLGL